MIQTITPNPSHEDAAVAGRRRGEARQWQTGSDGFPTAIAQTARRKTYWEACSQVTPALSWVREASIRQLRQWEDSHLLPFNHSGSFVFPMVRAIFQVWLKVFGSLPLGLAEPAWDHGTME